MCWSRSPHAATGSGGWRLNAQGKAVRPEAPRSAAVSAAALPGISASWKVSQSIFAQVAAAAWDKPRSARNGSPESVNSFVCFVYFVVKISP
jgi:hypothetical protein